MMHELEMKIITPFTFIFHAPATFSKIRTCKNVLFRFVLCFVCILNSVCLVFLFHYLQRSIPCRSRDLCGQFEQLSQVDKNGPSGSKDLFKVTNISIRTILPLAFAVSDASGRMISQYFVAFNTTKVVFASLRTNL